MIVTLLKKYIDRNADFVIINRAASYLPELVGKSPSEFVFTCQGSQVRPYEITVGWSANFEIFSECTCPYDGQGICKHQVAAIERLAQLFQTKSLDLDKLMIPKQQKEKSVRPNFTLIPHDNGVINTKKLDKIKFDHRSYSPFAEIRFTSVGRQDVKAQYFTFRDTLNLNLSYLKKTDEIRLSCSCGRQNPCGHKYAFLSEFLNRFDPLYFSDDYEEKIKKKILNKNQLQGVIDFDEAFQLEITQDGIQLNEKVQNIIRSEDSLADYFEEDHKELFLPEVEKKKGHYGLGLCLEKWDGRIARVFPFYGKLNKAQTKIATKLRDIDSYNFSEVLEIFEKSDDRDFILKSIQLSKKYSGIADHELSPETLKAAIGQFSAMHKDLEQRPLFLYNSEKTFTRKHVTALDFKTADIRPVLKIKKKKPFYQLDFKVRMAGKIHKLSSPKLKPTLLGIIHNGKDFHPFPNVAVAVAVLSAMDNSQLNVVDEGPNNLRKNIIDPYSKIYEINYAGIKKSKKKPRPKSMEKRVYLSDEDGEYLVMQPLVKYGEDLISPGSSEKVWANKDTLRAVQRDRDYEDGFLNLMQALHPEFEGKTNYFYLPVEKAMESLWLMQAIAELKEDDIRVFGLNDLKKIPYNLNKPTFSIGLSSGTDWFDMEMDVQFGDQKADLKSIQKAIVKQSNYVELKDGSLGILPKKWIEKYKKYFKSGQVKKDKIQISNYQFNIIDELYQEQETAPDFLKELYEKKKRLANLKDLKQVAAPENVDAKLRPYQQEGLNWLVFLHENKLGGCLADDMGLGKTVQTLAFLQYLKNSEKPTGKPHLVVAPTSLIFNWLAEIEKFTPDLKPLAFIGPDRDDQKGTFTNYDIVLTTYGSLIRDIEFHRKTDYNYVILDESQAIKNPQSQRFKAVRVLNCENRLALTGTPIENNTFDLYSQFNFLNPGIFGSVKHFRSTFSEPIDKEQDKDSSDLLARMISPFMLRRTKEKVAKELPPKTESVLYCEMGKDQRRVYDHFKEYFRQKLLEQIEEEGVNRSQMYILQGLTKLRQICNSSELAHKEKDYGAHSAKLDELLHHLKDKTANHKVLVFSQFTSMLKIVKRRLKEEKIKFEYLDGQTRKREKKVHNFQNDDDIRVFLISLKAGGTGLNLTKAEYVYLIDPWWNPAVESQAIDRSYRIGQGKKVMAYRMICKDTIEEKIVNLQNKKKTVAADVVRVDGEKKTFDKQDVELFFD